MSPSEQLPIGGLSGGLYHVFGTIGLTFFTFLIGSSRARHPSLEGSRVRMGGFLTLGLFAALSATIWLPAGLGTGGCFLGLLGGLVGGMLGVGLGEILLWYSRKIENEIHRERQWQTLYDEKYSALVKGKTAAPRARELATAYANEKTAKCFIATAAYGSPSAFEVEQLRWLRDEVLLTTGYGRLFVAFYYRISPRLASLIQPHQVARMFVRFLLSPLVWWASRIERTRERLIRGR